MFIPAMSPIPPIPEGAWADTPATATTTTNRTVVGIMAVTEVVEVRKVWSYILLKDCF